MQRRAAALYFAVFLLLGAGAYGFLQVGMDQPTVDLEGPAYAEGDDLTVEGQTYTVSAIEAGDGEQAPRGELTWFNESARGSATLENGSTIAFRDGQYSVVAGNASFALVEAFNVTAILAADPDVEDQVAEQGDRRYVFYANGTRQPLSEYLPEPDRAGPFEVGDTVGYRPDDETVSATVEAVTAEAVQVSWAAPENETLSFEDGGNVTLAGVRHFAHFPSESQVQILPVERSYESYAEDLARIEAFRERQAGFWGVTILSFLGAIVLLSTAYLPVRS